MTTSIVIVLAFVAGMVLGIIMGLSHGEENSDIDVIPDKQS